MAKYKEIVSMVLDMLKVTSDDSTYTEDHIIFLAGRYRSFLLKQRYSDQKKPIPESNYQTLCLSLEKADPIADFPYGTPFRRTVEQIPDMMPFGNTRVYASCSYYEGELTLVTKDRMKYVGYNKWMQNMIYACLDPNGHIYITSMNPQYMYLEEIKLNGIFENAEEVSDLECKNKDAEGNLINCDILDRDFPLEDALVLPMIELIVKDLSPSIATPEDKTNDANDKMTEN